MSYAEILQDPRWQRKRLEIMQAADFKCHECGDSETTLHVHHIKYVRGRKPWAYDASELRCLCKNCHAAKHGKGETVATPMRDLLLAGGPLDGQTFSTNELFPLLWVYDKEGDVFTATDAWREVIVGSREFASFFPKGGHPMTGNHSIRYHHMWGAPLPVLVGLYGNTPAGSRPTTEKTLLWSDPDALLLRITDAFSILDVWDENAWRGSEDHIWDLG